MWGRVGSMVGKATSKQSLGCHHDGARRRAHHVFRSAAHVRFVVVAGAVTPHDDEVAVFAQGHAQDGFCRRAFHGVLHVSDLMVLKDVARGADPFVG